MTVIGERMLDLQQIRRVFDTKPIGFTPVSDRTVQPGLPLLQRVQQLDSASGPG